MADELRKNPELNERQKRFVDNYIQSCNATDAAKKAGYSPTAVVSSKLCK